MAWTEWSIHCVIQKVIQICHGNSAKLFDYKERLGKRLIDWLIYLFIYLLIDWLIDWLIWKYVTPKCNKTRILNLSVNVLVHTLCVIICIQEAGACDGWLKPLFRTMYTDSKICYPSFRRFLAIFLQALALRTHSTSVNISVYGMLCHHL